MICGVDQWIDPVLWNVLNDDVSLRLYHVSLFFIEFRSSMLEINTER